MPEKLLHGTQVCAALEHMGSSAVPKCVWRHTGDPRLSGEAMNAFAHRARIDPTTAGPEKGCLAALVPFELNTNSQPVR